MMSEYVDEKELDNLKKTFRTIDENGDGMITLDEMKKAISSAADLGINEEELARIMKMSDINGDGVLSYEELLQATVARKLTAKEERLWDAFRKMDLNGDGRVSLDEIALVVGDRSKAQELLAEADFDGDGSVDYEEFLELWMNGAKV